MPSALRPFSRLDGIVYGPVSSRRFGASLGINLFPGARKICSFECPYCQLGNADEAMEKTLERQPILDPSEVESAIETVLRGMGRRSDLLNCLTFSGNGEPTAHPKFAAIVESTRLVRGRLAPMARIVVLTNAAHLKKPDVVEGLNRCDEIVVKLDAGTEEVFQKVNQPAKGLTLAGIVQQVKRLQRVTVQTMFVTGAVDNTTEAEVDAWLGHLREIKPASVQIYTLDRIPADGSVLPVPSERLREIARRVFTECGIEPLLTLPN
jgi:wyosine [tRNA(Phe)-imidazoG37] synthetase (radical SAM superfamily)